MSDLSRLPAPARTVIALSAAAVAVGQGFGRFTYGLLLPAMADDLVGSYERAGWLGTANLATYLVGILVVSVLSTRVDPLVIVRVGLTGTVLGLFVLAAAPDFSVLVLGMAVTGTCTAGLWVPLAGVVSSVTRVEQRGLAMGLVVAGVGLSIVASGQLVNLVRAVAGEDAWRPVWAVEAVIGVVVLLVVLWRLRPDTGATGTGPVRLSALLGVPRWWAVTGAYTAFGFAYSIYVNYVVAALEDDAGFSSSHASTVFSLLGITSIFGGILLGRWSDRAGRRAIFMGATILAALCSLAIPLGAEPWAAFSTAAFGLAMTGVGALVSAFIGDHLEARAVGAAFGVVTISFGLAQASAPYVGGWVADRAGSFTPTFLISAGAFAVSLALAWNLPRRGPLPPGLADLRPVEGTDREG